MRIRNVPWLAFRDTPVEVTMRRNVALDLTTELVSVIQRDCGKISQTEALYALDVARGMIAAVTDWPEPEDNSI